MPAASLRLGRNATTAQKSKAFIAKARAIHGRKYDYSKVRYTDLDTPVRIVCRRHGEFRTTPYNHTRPDAPSGCMACWRESRALKAKEDAKQKQQDFIARAKKLHGRKYDYSQVRYVNVDTPVKVLCLKHGEFFPSPWSHAGGDKSPKSGCPKCGDERGSKQIRDRHKAMFVSRARKVHGDAYDYGKTVYKDARSKLTIACRKHGHFCQVASSHLQGIGCPACGLTRRGLRRRKEAAEGFVAKARNIHGRKYRYDETIYVRASGMIIVTCPKHGDFKQTANNHLHGFGCRKCQSETLRKAFADTKTDFIRKARKKHGDKFAYAGKYVNSRTPMLIRCKLHGEFRQKPIDHVKGTGCPQCGREKMKLAHLSSHDEFVRKARAVHGAQYGYPEPYKLARQHLQVGCIKHGLFSVTPNNLLRGHGCPVCAESFGEKKVARALETLRVSYTREKRFPDCRDKRPLRFDFWLSSLNTLVEFDGLQHHEPYELFGGEKMFAVTQRRDRIKTAYARKKKIRLIRVKYSVRDVEAFLVKRLGFSPT